MAICRKFPKYPLSEIPRQFFVKIEITILYSITELQKKIFEAIKATLKNTIEYVEITLRLCNKTLIKAFLVND